MHSNHSSSLSGAIDALNATTLRLPVVGGVKVCASNFATLPYD